MPRLVLFDVDLTLIRTQWAGRAAMDAALTRVFGLTDPCRDLAFEGRTDRAIFMDAIALHRLADCDLEGVYRRATDAYVEELGPALVARAGVVLPGVEALLAALSASHRAVGLATGNMRRGAQLKLGHFALWDRFAAGGFGDATPVRAEVVLEGVRALAAFLGCDANPGDTVVVGDTPLDVAAARAAGARALAVATGSFDVAALASSGADWVLEDLSDTARVLSILST